MSAWVFALVCLFHTAACPSRSATPSAPLAIYLTSSPNQPSATVEFMKRELTPLLRDAGYRPIWGDFSHPDPLGSASLVVLELRGLCTLPAGADRLEPAVRSGASLAETVVSTQGVTPFSRVNCANLTRLIGPELSSEPPALREYLYGRAMARVVAHEIYHVLTGSRDHGRNGIAKSDFTVADLLDEVFRFDAAELAQLQRKAIRPDADAAVDSAVGR